MQSERKKQLKREYLRSARAMGAYCIRNRINQKVFVGVSRDIEARLNRHRFQLRMGSEELSTLQADWNALAPQDFEFEILQTLEPPQDAAGYDPQDDLAVLLAIWCDQLNAYSPAGYNTRPAS